MYLFQLETPSVPTSRAELAGRATQAGRVGHPGGRDGAGEDGAGHSLPDAPQGDQPG